jgi:hypothetical protein
MLSSKSMKTPITNGTVRNGKSVLSLFRYAIATSGSTPHRVFGMNGAVEKSRAAGVSFGSLLAT